MTGTERHRPIPTLPGDPPNGGQNLPILPGVTVMTERVSDAVAQVANPQNHGIISDDGYNTAKPTWPTAAPARRLARSSAAA